MVVNSGGVIPSVLFTLLSFVQAACFERRAVGDL
jgi:hypothetical protein